MVHLPVMVQLIARSVLLECGQKRVLVLVNHANQGIIRRKIKPNVNLAMLVIFQTRQTMMHVIDAHWVMNLDKQVHFVPNAELDIIKMVNFHSVFLVLLAILHHLQEHPLAQFALQEHSQPCMLNAQIALLDQFLNKEVHTVECADQVQKQ